MGFAKIQVYTCVFLFSSRLSALDERFVTRLRGKAALSDLKPSGMATFGHTPWRVIYGQESGGCKSMPTADTAIHFVLPLAGIPHAVSVGLVQ